MEEERTVVCTAMRLFTSKVGGMEEGVKGRRIQGCSQIYEGVRYVRVSILREVLF